MSTKDDFSLEQFDAGDGKLATLLLNAAEAELDITGAAGFSLRAIARSVGVSHQAPGHHYGNRSGLLTAVATRALRRVREGTLAALAQTENVTARERLGAVATAYATLAGEHPGVVGLANRPDLLDFNHPQLLEERQATWQAFLDLISAAQAEGWHAGQPTDLLALRTGSLVHGAVTLWMSGLAGDRSRRTADLVALIGQLTEGL